MTGQDNRLLLRKEVYNRFFTNAAGGAVFSLSWGGNITFTPKYTWRITAVQMTAIAQPAAGPYVAVACRMSISNAVGYVLNKQLDNQGDALVPGFSPSSAFFTFGPSTGPRNCDIEISAGVPITLQGVAYANLALADQVDFNITMEYEVYNN